MICSALVAAAIVFSIVGEDAGEVEHLLEDKLPAQVSHALCVDCECLEQLQRLASHLRRGHEGHAKDGLQHRVRHHDRELRLVRAQREAEQRAQRRLLHLLVGRGEPREEELQKLVAQQLRRLVLLAGQPAQLEEGRGRVRRRLAMPPLDEVQLLARD
eukprot:CAMPEP_0113239124 /NCGR_PEP_ID=MMETSP0008_2-20120614/5536_1 /TAXON_ID=97485 /ORGANISM="Prymnesium parvum" /LENGTH=157 /DNA_ID=CAMNT_0000086325 /DNA_START=747 /DNA_END=1216 /DNA_ORIENTATION=- /assembly_acc=CAM_ASM_000153